jgi:hypothetical protein
MAAHRMATLACLALLLGSSPTALAALAKSSTVNTADIQNEFIKQLQFFGITNVLLLENSLATPFYRGVIKTGLGYTSVSVDDNTDEQHKLSRVWRFNNMGALHPEYALTGKLAIAVASSGKVRCSPASAGHAPPAPPARCDRRADAALRDQRRQPGARSACMLCSSPAAARRRQGAASAAQQGRCSRCRICTCSYAHRHVCRMPHAATAVTAAAD